MRLEGHKRIITAARAGFEFSLATDLELNLPPVTFYRAKGVALGTSSLYAVYTGFLLHMKTGVVTGIVYGALSQSIRKYIKSLQKGLGVGVLAGAVVLVVLLPLGYTVAQPTLNNVLIC